MDDIIKISLMDRRGVEFLFSFFNLKLLLKHVKILFLPKLFLFALLKYFNDIFNNEGKIETLVTFISYRYLKDIIDISNDIGNIPILSLLIDNNITLSIVLSHKGICRSQDTPTAS